MTYAKRAFWAVLAYVLALGLIIGLVELGMFLTGASP